MIISRGRRYIFVHIPKTGGTALALALEGRAMKDDILIGDTPKALSRRPRLQALSPRGRLWKHSSLADIDGIVSAADLARFHIFTLVRNPWDRMVSYYHWLRDQSFCHSAVALSKAHSFSDFLNHPQIAESFRANPAASYLCDATGQERAASFLRLEHLAKDIAPLQAHLGFDLLPLPRSNPSRRNRDWRPYYSDADAAVLADICAADIARFGYGFEDAGISDNSS
tara:strand:- start:3518 stop:4195 length:678 start_codon:yes stop_codon:yes gene_type:complete